MSFKQLLAKYNLTRADDLKGDWNLGRLLNISAMLLGFLIVVVGYFIKLFSDGIDFQVRHFFVLIGGLGVSILLHELIHALFMRLFL